MEVDPLGILPPAVIVGAHKTVFVPVEGATPLTLHELYVGGGLNACIYAGGPILPPDRIAYQAMPIGDLDAFVPPCTVR